MERHVRLQGRACDEDDVVDWGAQLCDALAYIHAKGMVFGRMRPSNVLLCTDGFVKLLGLPVERGVAQSADCDVLPLRDGGYVCPETEVDQRSDVYELGATLLYLATGKSPYDFEYRYPLPPARSVNPVLTKGLENVIAKAVQLNPEHRYQDCIEMRYDLLEGQAAMVHLYASPKRSLFSRIKGFGEALRGFVGCGGR